MAIKKGDQLRFCCYIRYLNSVTVKYAYPTPTIDESLSKLNYVKLFTTLHLGSAFWQVPLRKQDKEKTGFACELGCFNGKDALWSLQCHGYVSTIDGTRIDKSNEEIWQPGDVIRGRRGNSDTYFRGPHRATRQGVRLHEKSGTKIQAIKVRDTQGLD